MKHSEYYEVDVLRFFDGHPQERELYEALFRLMEAEFPEASVKVQKSQISFYDRHLFAAVSPALRRKKSWLEHCILATFGLSYQTQSPRIAVATEPYPNRWTHHVLISQPSDIDEELLGWLREAWTFAKNKGGRRRAEEDPHEDQQPIAPAPMKGEKKRSKPQTYSIEKLEEARRSIASTQMKCEKALEKLTPGKSQHTLTARRIAAFQIALELIDQALEKDAEP